MDGSNGVSLQKAYDNDDENDSYDEEGNNGAPYLLSNLEVLEILQPRVHYRHRISTTSTSTTHATSNANNSNDISAAASAAAAAATAKSSVLAMPMTSKNGMKQHMMTTGVDRTMKKRQKLLRHRNWIEDEVVQYIQQTAAMEFHSTRNSLPLKSILRRRKRRALHEPLPLSSLPDQSPTTMTISDNAKPAAILSSTSDEIKKILKMGFHLTEAEIIQILNHSPKEMVDMHLYIDQIHERFTITEQEELLRAVDHYRTLQPQLPTPNNGNDTARRQSQLPNHSTHSNDSMTCNGVDTKRLRYTESNTLNVTNVLKQVIDECEYHDQPALTDATTTAASIITMASSHTNHVKLEMSESDERKPTSI